MCCVDKSVLCLGLTTLGTPEVTIGYSCSHNWVHMWSHWVHLWGQQCAESWVDNTAC